jgi:cell wall-associated NlpC family hydrolase
MRAALIIPALVLAIASPAALAVTAAAPSASSADRACSSSPAQPGLGLTVEQRSNAAVIMSVGDAMGVPARGAVVAIATALQESRLRNLPYGDRDSLGLFQQRPSQGWGSPAQIEDPGYAARQFFAHLVAVPGWTGLSVTVAAQAVQRSATPDAYAQWEGEATAIVNEGDGRADPMTCAPVAGTRLSAVVRFAVAQLGKPYVFGADGPGAWDCSSLVQASYATAGVILPRTADQQYDYLRTRGTLLPRRADISQLQAGDLLFSRGDDPRPAADGQLIGHVALYAGNGVVIEAEGVPRGVLASHYTQADLGWVSWVGRLGATDHGPDVFDGGTR